MAGALPIEVTAGRRGLLGMAPARFLRDYWQRRPLLVRGALAPWREPLTPEDLAGLACEELALARLVCHDRQRDAWTVEHGPFAEDRFPTLPRRDWTLLVQDVDKWDADVAALLDGFAFLPRWRLDDVMVSFAAPGGSVGPHVDQYDVFLIQGRGRRRWRIDVSPDPPRAFRPGQELKLLQRFQPSHDWVLEPGDMLYLPPGVPHHGEAVDACMTFSVGLRAPSLAEMLADLAEHLERDEDGPRYADPGLRPALDPGLVDRAALARVRAQLQRAVALDDDELATWFGAMITRYRSSGLASPPPRRIGLARLHRELEAGACILPHPFARIAWTRTRSGALLFADGSASPAEVATAQRLCSGVPLDRAGFLALDPAGQERVLEWLHAGKLVLRRPRRERA